MTDTILVLTEDTLAAADVEHILSLHPDETLAYRVLVPQTPSATSSRRSSTTSAWASSRRPGTRSSARSPPRPGHRDRAGAARRERRRAPGRGPRGRRLLTDDDPLPALRAAVAAGDVREIAIVTYPHAIEDTFHQDWASRAREELHVPVLHLYSGTSELG
ncbi:hypothetical protein NKG05_27090 [Oerskovia sp. M15]